MKFVIDANVLIALLLDRHVHHVSASSWLQNVAESESVGICRVVQLTALRVTTNRNIMGDVRWTGADFWRALDTLLEDKRIGWVDEGSGFDMVYREFSSSVPLARLIDADVYIASLATSSNATVVTFDRGFTGFENVQVQVLS